MMLKNAEEVFMDVRLSPDLKRMVVEVIRAGRHQTASDVISESLHLWFETQAMEDDRREGLQEDVALGLHQLDRGEAIAGQEGLAEVMQRLAAR